MFVEFDLVAEEEDFITTSGSDEAPEVVEETDDLDHLYMSEQLYLQSIFDL